MYLLFGLLGGETKSNLQLLALGSKLMKRSNTVKSKSNSQ